jgi:hypothetical protein
LAELLLALNVEYAPLDIYAPSTADYFIRDANEHWTQALDVDEILKGEMKAIEGHRLLQRVPQARVVAHLGKNVIEIAPKSPSGYDPPIIVVTDHPIVRTQSL